MISVEKAFSIVYDLLNNHIQFPKHILTQRVETGLISQGIIPEESKFHHEIQYALTDHRKRSQYAVANALVRALQVFGYLEKPDQTSFPSTGV